MLDNEVKGQVEVQLVTSRDGYRWDHPFPDQAFIPRGPKGDFDDMTVFLTQPVIHGDKISHLIKSPV